MLRWHYTTSLPWPSSHDIDLFKAITLWMLGCEPGLPVIFFQVQNEIDNHGLASIYCNQGIGV
jgi:hypothetical protein